MSDYDREKAIWEQLEEQADIDRARAQRLAGQSDWYHCLTLVVLAFSCFMFLAWLIGYALFH